MISKTQPPNILMISVHDLGTRLRCYGYESIQSPNLDRLAAEGARFEKNFCTSPYCSPSRGSMITGLYPHANGLMGLVNLGWQWRSENVTIARALGSHGYETYLFGFQHEASDDRVEDLGFQHVSDRGIKQKCSNVAPQVMSFLKSRKVNPKPFYARVGFTEVHRSFNGYTPEDPSEVTLPGWMEDTPGAREDLAQYDGAIRHMDAAVGDILAELEAAGLSQNTLVVFTTDHGPPFPWAKSTLYDAGVNTALIARWPGGFNAGQVRNELISNVDLFPTLLEVAGTDVPKNIHGRSFLPLLQGGDYEPRSEIFTEKNTNATDIKRSVRTDRYKFIRNYVPGPGILLADSEGSLTRRDMGNAHTAPRPEFELYDMIADPYEKENLAGLSEVTEIQADLAERLERIQKETDDLLLDGPIPRPEREKEILDGAYRNVIRRCGYSRDGLVNTYEESFGKEWTFAETPAKC